MRSLALMTLALGAMALTPALAEEKSVESGTTPQTMAEKADAPMASDAEKPAREGRFANTDTDSDGFISMDEFMAESHKRAEERFAKLDADSDGKISREEIQAKGAKMREHMKERMQGRMEECKGDEKCMEKMQSHMEKMKEMRKEKMQGMHGKKDMPDAMAPAAGDGAAEPVKQ